MGEKSLEKLHLGCGQRHIAGFFHIDALDYPLVDRQGPVDDLSFLDADTVGMIYACHVLEHFGRKEYLDVLEEWYRVIRPGGLLRLAVPDFEACAQLFVAGKLARGIEDIRGLICGGQRDEYDYHKIIFDEASMSADLEAIGFSEIRLWDWRESEHSHIDDYSKSYLPHMDQESGRLMSLNIEAVK